MQQIVKLNGSFSRLEDTRHIKKSNRFTDRFINLDYDFYIEKNSIHCCIAIFLLEEATYYVILDLNSKYISEYPAELFSDREFIIPKSWTLVIGSEISPQLVHPKFIRHKSWWTLYNDDDPEILAIVDEIIQEIQAEEDAKNPKKDPFDEYWGL